MQSWRCSANSTNWTIWTDTLKDDTPSQIISEAGGILVPHHHRAQASAVSFERTIFVSSTNALAQLPGIVTPTADSSGQMYHWGMPRLSSTPGYYWRLHRWWLRSCLFIRDKIVARQFQNDIGSYESIVKPTFEAHLKSNLDHHAWAASNSLISTYGQRFLTLNIGLPNQFFGCF